jgi:hypothetical protein
VLSQAKGRKLPVTCHLDYGLLVQAEIFSGLLGMKERFEGRLGIYCHERKYLNGGAACVYHRTFCGLHQIFMIFLLFAIAEGVLYFSAISDDRSKTPS